jgi:hypothetical protein
MRTSQYLVLGVATLLLTWRVPCPSPAAADEGPVVEVGDLRPTAADLKAEFAYLPPPVLQRLRNDDNAARIFAVDWYARALFAKAAKEDGLLAKSPGLVAAATSRERDLIATQYLRQTEGEFRVTNEEAEQFRKMEPEVCREPGRVHFARIGVITGKKAASDEAELAGKRFADIQKRIAAGEDFGKIADEASDYSSKAAGGDMGWMEIEKVRESPHGEAILKLAVGEVSQPLDTGQGKVVYKILAREDAHDLPAAECRERVDKLLTQKYRKETFLRRVDELAARFKASLNLDAFIAAVRAVPLQEGWERTYQSEEVW